MDQEFQYEAVLTNNEITLNLKEFFCFKKEQNFF